MQQSFSVRSNKFNHKYRTDERFNYNQTYTNKNFSPANDTGDLFFDSSSLPKDYYDNYYVKYFGKQIPLPKDVSKRFAYISGLDFTQGFYLEKTKDAWIHKKVRNVSNKLLQSHFEGEIEISLPVFPTSKVLIIDIDSRSQLPEYKNTDVIVDQLEQDFNCKAFYKEYSDINNNHKNVHLYFNLNDFLNLSGHKYLMKHYKDTYNYVIESIYPGLNIRVPFSKKYKNLAISGDNTIINNVLQLEACFNTKANFTAKIPYWLNKHNLSGLPIIKTRELEDNKSKSNNTSFTKSYGCGTRHITQVEAALYCTNNNYTFDEFVTLCYSLNDGTSKDMKKSQEKILKMLTDIWDWALKNKQSNETFKNTLSKDTVGNTKRYINFEEFEYNDEEWEFLTEYFNYFYEEYKIGFLNGKKQKEFILNCIIVMENINSKKMYDIKTKAKYEDEDFNLLPLNNGTLFNTELRTMMAREIGIKNIKKIFKFLVKTKVISPIIINSYTYSYKGKRYGQHFQIHSFTYLKQRLANSIKIKSTINNSNTPINIINMLYNKVFNVNSYKLCCQVSKNRILTDGILDDRLEKIRRWRKYKASLLSGKLE